MLSQTMGKAQKSRQNWLNTLALSQEDKLETYYANSLSDLSYHYLREPEIGLVMVRARAGGSGKQFNLGEVTVARCSVTLADETIGHGYVKGRSKRHAELIALIDAAFQVNAPDVAFLEDLRSTLSAQRETVSRKVAATKVDFYTMVRGED